MSNNKINKSIKIIILVYQGLKRAYTLTHARLTVY